MPKQVRFAQLIKAAGRPHAATLWVANPVEDPEFKKAMAENRLLTVHYINVGSKKESAEIGFRPGSGLSYMIFDKPLPFSVDTRVVGLKFDELAQKPVQDPVKIKQATRHLPIEQVKIVQFPGHGETETPPSKKEKDVLESDVPGAGRERKPSISKRLKTVRSSSEASRYVVTVEFTATITNKLEVEAENAASAMRNALAQALEPTGKIRWKRDVVEASRKK